MIVKSNYIKVTPKGETRSIIILAANTNFFKSQGAKIEEPSEGEIMAAFPELSKSSHTFNRSGSNQEKDVEIERLKTELENNSADLVNYKIALDEATLKIKELNAEIAQLKTKQSRTRNKPS